MAKPRAWIEGVKHEKELQAKEAEFRKAIPAAIAYIQEHPLDCPHTKEPLQTQIMAILEDPKKVSSLVEQWYFQNGFSVVQSLLEKVGCHSEYVAQEFFFAFTKVTR